jgi:hypothetical protein
MEAHKKRGHENEMEEKEGQRTFLAQKRGIMNYAKN